MTLAQASSTASSRFDISGSSSCACRPTAVTNSRISDRFSVDEGTCRVNFLSKEVILKVLLIETAPPVRSVNREIMQRRAFVICHRSLFICHWPGNRPVNIGRRIGTFSGNDQYQMNNEQ